MLSWDTGPANCLLDVAAARVTAGMHGCDEDGRLALAGQVRDDLLDLLLSHPYYRLPPPVSTGRETFSAAYLGEVLAAVDLVGPDDLLATLTELTAETVARALAAYAPAEVIASGGGTRNPALMAALRRALDRSCSGARLVTSDEAGLPAQAKEALLWALLGFLTWHGVPGTNGATGSRLPRILGRISPGHGPLVMPAPVGLTPTRLVLS